MGTFSNPNLKTGRDITMDDLESKSLSTSEGATKGPPADQNVGATTGVKFFNGRKATPAESAAKQKALVSKLRARDHDDFQGSGY